MNKCFTLLLMLIFSNSLAAMKISGRVVFEQEPIAYANVYVANSTLGTYTDFNGSFTLDFDLPLPINLQISALGYSTKNMMVKDLQDSIYLGEIALTEDALGLEELVVTGTMSEVFIKNSPVKIEVITTKHLEAVSMPSNLVQSISLVNGLQEVVACGVCYTNSISINGLPGSYTAVLIDGSPIYGNLASVYGLNGIPRQIIDRIEVIKGPNSTLYGSEAVAGVINIITKNPEQQPSASIDWMLSTHGESYTNISWAPKFKKWKGLVGLNHGFMNSYEDANNDHFGDRIGMDRYSFFTKWKKQRKSNKLFQWALKLYFEDRRNGVEEYFKNRNYKQLRGSSTVYGESIYTKRYELFGTYELNTKEDIKLDFTVSNHNQDSYYGSDAYMASQQIAFANLVWKKTKKNHHLLMGATTRLQLYDDNTIATEKNMGQKVENMPDNQFIPGLFVQDEWSISNDFKLLTGLRLDNYQAHGPIVSPRLNLKWNLAKWTSIRSNFGTGFKIVNLFTEDHAFVTGQRDVVIAEELNPERSYNGSINLNHVYTLGTSQGVLDVDFYYTYFTNKILPNYDNPGQIVYQNSEGIAFTKGIGIQINHSFTNSLKINAGANFQKAQTVNKLNGIETRSNILYAVNTSGNAAISYKLSKPNILIAYTLNATGSMELPEVYDVDESGQVSTVPRPLRSKPYMLHNLQVTKKLKSRVLNIYVGVQNIFNFIPNYSPLVAYNDSNYPVGFSPYFDTSYAYAPLHGREIYVGFRWDLQLKKTK